jgi:hypothetical protein
VSLPRTQSYYRMLAGQFGRCLVIWALRGAIGAGWYAALQWVLSRPRLDVLASEEHLSGWRRFCVSSASWMLVLLLLTALAWWWCAVGVDAASWAGEDVESRYPVRIRLRFLLGCLTLASLVVLLNLLT